jgi:hypothetical protein
MNLTDRTEEPLVAIILKGLSILSAVGAVIFYISMFRHDVPPDASAELILKAVVELRLTQAMAFTLTGAAIALWWMGEIIALLARIAANGAKQAAVSQVAAVSKPRPAAAFTRRTHEDDDVPRYSL